MEDRYYHTEASVKEYVDMAKDVSGMALIEELKAFLPQGASVLEIGSGPGTDWNILSSLYEVTGSDSSKEFLKHLKSANPEGKFLELDASTLLTNKAFSGVYSNKVLHHLSDDELRISIKRQADILEPNGIVCHSFWKGEGSEVFKGMFVNYHSKADVLSFFEAYFESLLVIDYAEFEEGDSILFIGKKK